MHIFHTRFIRPVSFLFLSLLLLSLCSSCTLMQQSQSPLPGKHIQPFAEQLFLNGDFETALLTYQQIYETALSPEDRNHALYGLACTQMLLADNEEQFIEAINYLQKWDAGKGNAPFNENRRLLVLALNQHGKRITEQGKQRSARETAQTTLIDDQEKKISEMAATVEKLQTQIEELHNQIAALEAIDENVQEKQKSL